MAKRKKKNEQELAVELYEKLVSVCLTTEVNYAVILGTLRLAEEMVIRQATAHAESVLSKMEKGQNKRPGYIG